MANNCQDDQSCHTIVERRICLSSMLSEMGLGIH